MASKPKNDFDTSKLVETSGKHDEEISSLKNRIKSLEDKFGSNEKIADTLCETAEKATKMQEMLTSTFLKQIKTNPDIKEALESLVDTVDRSAVKKFVKRVGFTGWSAIIFVLGVIVTIIANNLLAK